MKYNEVMKVGPGTVLLVNSELFQVLRVSGYKCRTASWLNLAARTSSGGEKVLELSDGDIRLWRQVFDLSGVSPATESVDYHGHHFEVDESRVRAKTVTRNVAGKDVQEDSVTSVYVDEKDESGLLSIETKGEKLFVWYSNKMVSPKNIKTSK